MTQTGPVPSTLVARIRELAGRRSWLELVHELDGVEQARLVEVPEMAVQLADALWRVGQADRSAETARLAEHALRNVDGHGLLLNAVNIRGIALFETGRVDDAGAAFGELLEMATEWDDHDFAARASNNLGVHASVQDRYDAALVHYERALASYIRLGQVRGIAQTHYNLGVNYRELGFFDKAESHYQLALSYAERSGSEDVMGLAESDRGLLRVQMGDPELGRVFAERARERFRGLSDPVREGEALRVLGLAAAATGASEEAETFLNEALALARRHGNTLLHAEVQRARGKLLAGKGDVEGAREALADAAAQLEALGATRDAAEVGREAAAL